jgi:hypothetical protein
MSQRQEIEQIWHNDHHVLSLRINRADLEIMDIVCPASEPSADCLNSHGECLVQWFISRYGMDCNGGVCMASQNMEICWTIIGEKENPESSQLWFMPLSDEVFQAWLTSNSEH